MDGPQRSVCGFFSRSLPVLRVELKETRLPLSSENDNHDDDDGGGGDGDGDGDGDHDDGDHDA